MANTDRMSDVYRQYEVELDNAAQWIKDGWLDGTSEINKASLFDVIVWRVGSSVEEEYVVDFAKVGKKRHTASEGIYTDWWVHRGNGVQGARYKGKQVIWEQEEGCMYEYGGEDLHVGHSRNCSKEVMKFSKDGVGKDVCEQVDRIGYSAVRSKIWLPKIKYECRKMAASTGNVYELPDYVVTALRVIDMDARGSYMSPIAGYRDKVNGIRVTQIHVLAEMLIDIAEEV